jgi:GTP cyclohydrolase I
MHHTPLPAPHPPERGDPSPRPDARALEATVARLIAQLGEDVTREGLQRTPARVGRSLRFLTSGYAQDAESVVRGALFRTEGEGLVVVKGLEFYSLCEHHLLPFFGRVHIGYVPGEHILGLSKFARVVDVFARRLQVQERLTAQIADALERVLHPRGVAVVVEASHLCMMMRGVQQQGSSTRTSVIRGVLGEARVREEFLGAIER